MTQVEFNAMLQIAIAEGLPGGVFTCKYSGEEMEALLEGRSLVIGGSYATLAELEAAYPSGGGGMYQAQDTGDMYVWNEQTGAWESVGQLIGPKGETGEQGPQGEKGDTGEKGETGEAGHTPVRGTDYWTVEDQQSIVDAVLANLANGDEVSY